MFNKCDNNKKCQPCRFCYIQGPTGPQGPQGPTTITVRSTTTSEPGTNASVTNGGTPQNLLLDFVIPRGADGTDGVTGPTGPQGPQGPIGPTPPLFKSSYIVKFHKTLITLDAVLSSYLPTKILSIK